MCFPSLQLIDRATSPRDEGDPKAEQKTLEESWQDLALIKAAPKPPKKQRREDLSEPLLSPARPPAPGEAHGVRVAPTMVRRIPLMCSGLAVPMVWKLRVIFSWVSGKLILPCWEDPESQPHFRQCIYDNIPAVSAWWGLCFLWSCAGFWVSSAYRKVPSGAAADKGCLVRLLCPAACKELFQVGKQIPDPVWDCFGG